MNALVRSTVTALSLGAAAEALLAGGAVRFLGFESGAGVLAGLLYLGVAVLVVLRIAAFHPHRRFGAANGLTLARLVLTCLFAGLVGETAMTDGVLRDEEAWSFCTLGIFVLMLDGVDGYVARRSGLASAFGARFDMETDALFILVLSILAFTLQKAGAWVIAAGLLRYIYVAGGWLWPPLAHPLPDSARRKIVCVAQCGVLVMLLAPVITPPASAYAAAAALILLVYSFAVDVAWVIVHRNI